MDSFFGIGLFELVMIAVVALVVLGPERLPGAMREVAKWMRQLRNLSNEFQSQFSEEFKMLDELNPRRIINEVIDPNATPNGTSGGSARPGAGQPAKPAAAKPVTPPAPKPAAPKPPAAKPLSSAAPAVPTGISASLSPDEEVENSILPPAKAGAPDGSSAPAGVETGATNDAQPAPARDYPLDIAPPPPADAGQPEPGTAQ